jgi:hypothetical protein
VPAGATFDVVVKGLHGLYRRQTKNLPATAPRPSGFSSRSRDPAS